MKFALYNFQLPVFELFIIRMTDLSIATSDLSLVKWLLSEGQIWKADAKTALAFSLPRLSWLVCGLFVFGNALDFLKFPTFPLANVECGLIFWLRALCVCVSPCLSTSAKVNREPRWDTCNQYEKLSTAMTSRSEHNDRPSPTPILNRKLHARTHSHMQTCTSAHTTSQTFLSCCKWTKS